MYKLMLILVFLSIQSCSSAKSDSTIYSVGKEYYYKVEKTDSLDNILYSDTLVLRIETSGFLGLFNQKKAYWYSNGSKQTGDHWRGFTDDGKSLEIQVPIHIDELNNLTIAPYPKTMVPPKEGYKISSSHTFVKGYGEQTGKTIRQEITIGKKVACFALGEKTQCWRIEGQNTSLVEQEGLHKMTALFDLKTGFIEWEYSFPNNTTVVFRLVEIQ